MKTKTKLILCFAATVLLAACAAIVTIKGLTTNTTLIAPGIFALITIEFFRRYRREKKKA